MSTSNELNSCKSNSNFQGNFIYPSPIPLEIKNPPIAFIYSPSVKNNGEETYSMFTIPIYFDLSQYSNDFTINDIVTTNGFLTNFSGKDDFYSAVFNPTETECTIKIPANKFTNLNGNRNLESNLFKFKVTNITNINQTWINNNMKPNSSFNLKTSLVVLDENVELKYNSFLTFDSLPTGIQVNGKNNKFTINGVKDFSGLFQNGSLLQNQSVNDISISNFHIESENSSLAENQGWLCQEYFSYGKNNDISNCSSNGIISKGSGGIVGQKGAYKGGNLTITNCSSVGNIDVSGGGIIGQYAGDDEGTVLLNYCHSSGNIGSDAGGIVGYYSGDKGTVKANYCYSRGIIADFAGGIFGRNVSWSIGSYSEAKNSYSLGEIGQYAGGIFGPYLANSSGSASALSCFSLGKINPYGGGIHGAYTSYGNTLGGVRVENSYSRGNISEKAGGIYGAYMGKGIGPNNSLFPIQIGLNAGIVTNSYSSGTYSDNTGIYGFQPRNDSIKETNTYAANGNWSSETANNSLINVSTPFNYNDSTVYIDELDNFPFPLLDNYLVSPIIDISANSSYFNYYDVDNTLLYTNNENILMDLKANTEIVGFSIVDISGQNGDLSNLKTIVSQKEFTVVFSPTNNNSNPIECQVFLPSNQFQSKNDSIMNRVSNIFKFNYLNIPVSIDFSTNSFHVYNKNNKKTFYSNMSDLSLNIIFNRPYDPTFASSFQSAQTLVKYDTNSLQNTSYKFQPNQTSFLYGFSLIDQNAKYLRMEIQVPENVYKDYYGNFNLLKSFTFNWSKISPILVIKEINGENQFFKTNKLVTLEIQSNEIINEFSINNISFANCKLESSRKTENDKSILLDISGLTPINNYSTCLITVSPQTVKDYFGNYNNTDVSYTFFYRDLANEMTINSSDISNESYTNKTEIPFDFNFLVSCSLFSEDMIDLCGGNIKLNSFNSNSDKTKYSIVFIPTQLKCQVGANTTNLKDDFGNNINPPIPNPFTFEFSNKTLEVAIQSNDISNNMTSNKTSIDFNITMSDSTSNFNINDLSTTNGTLSNLRGSGSQYQVTFSPSKNDNCSIFIPENSFKDKFGNNNEEASFQFVANITLLLDQSWFNKNLVSSNYTLTFNALITEDISISTKNYLIIDNDSITIDGSGHTIICDYNNTEKDFIGLIRNEDYNITIKNLNFQLTHNVLKNDCGLLGSSNFSQSKNCTIENCKTTGHVSQYGGGLVGKNSCSNPGGTLMINNCKHNGSIDAYAGGLVGHHSGCNQGFITINNSSSNGTISSYAGGLLGSECGQTNGLIVLNNCYSSGTIANEAGGIIGAHTAYNNGEVNISKCFSLGSIGPYGGGLIGSKFGVPQQTTDQGSKSLFCNNSYSLGDINKYAGGIIGSDPNATNITIDTCFSRGNIMYSSIELTGGIILGSFTSQNNTIVEIKNCYGSSGSENKLYNSGLTGQTTNKIISSYNYTDYPWNEKDVNRTLLGIQTFDGSNAQVLPNTSYLNTQGSLPYPLSWQYSVNPYISFESSDVSFNGKLEKESILINMYSSIELVDFSNSAFQLTLCTIDEIKKISNNHFTVKIKSTHKGLVSISLLPNSISGINGYGNMEAIFQYYSFYGNVVFTIDGIQNEYETNFSPGNIYIMDKNWFEENNIPWRPISNTETTKNILNPDSSQLTYNIITGGNLKILNYTMKFYEDFKNIKMFALGSGGAGSAVGNPTSNFDKKKYAGGGGGGAGELQCSEMINTSSNGLDTFKFQIGGGGKGGISINSENTIKDSIYQSVVGLPDGSSNLYGKKSSNGVIQMDIWTSGANGIDTIIEKNDNSIAHAKGGGGGEGKVDGEYSSNINRGGLKGSTGATYDIGPNTSYNGNGGISDSQGNPSIHQGQIYYKSSTPSQPWGIESNLEPYIGRFGGGGGGGRSNLEQGKGGYSGAGFGGNTSKIHNPQSWGESALYSGSGGGGGGGLLSGLSSTTGLGRGGNGGNGCIIIYIPSDP